MRFETDLPIDAVLADLTRSLALGPSAVLVAPPGAGKTTRVPLAILDEAWLAGRKILVLEPRRIAARAAAERMALTLGQSLGDMIGLRARLNSRTGPRTRIEVVTEGVFTRMILDDPELSGVGAVLFDEFHERSLDADLGLALALDTQRALRPDLRILIMSATLDGGRIAQLLGDAPIVASEGRSYPVETHYLGRDPTRRIEDAVVAAVERALRAESGSILVFLPGQGEIRRVEERLAPLVADRGIVLAALYGALDPEAQDRAISPVKAPRRKVVLATAIAETSLTIDGVRVVIDSGLMRVPRFEPDQGVTRLETVRVSRASADQRRGRAGRTEPGVCYRLWDEPQTQSLKPFNDPEIRSADLSSLILDCAEWGVTEPQSLAWLDPPGAAALSAARAGLEAIGALDRDGNITAIGRQIRALPLPPPLARMLIFAGTNGRTTAERAADVAAVLVERGLGGTGSDLVQRVDSYQRDRSRRAEDMRRLASGWLKSFQIAPEVVAGEAVLSVAQLVALAYPDRLAKARGGRGQFLLASGRGAYVDETDSLSRVPFLAVAEMQGAAAQTRILAAAAIPEVELLEIAADRITTKDEVSFDREAAAVRARRVSMLGAITLKSEARTIAPDNETARLLAHGVAHIGIGALPWTKGQIQLRDRVAFVRAAEGASSRWPDLSDAALAVDVETWLAPYVSERLRVTDITASDLDAALTGLVPWADMRRLDELAPTHFEAPTGNRHSIDYEGAGAPALAIRVQELYGVKSHPSIAGGRLPLTLTLLSPAHRPIQITRDLPGFWAGSWREVKADMKGRYPRHVWPDDPANAVPTTRAKPRGT